MHVGLLKCNAGMKRLFNYLTYRCLLCRDILSSRDERRILQFPRDPGVTPGHAFTVRQSYRWKFSIKCGFKTDEYDMSWMRASAMLLATPAIKPI